MTRKPSSPLLVPSSLVVPRRTVLTGLTGLAAAPLLASALPRPAIAARKVRIMLVLWRGETPVEKGFRDQLQQEGIDAEFIIRDAGQDTARIAAFAAEAKTLRPDLIHVWGTTATVTLVGKRGEVDADRHVTDIPVVFSMVTSPTGAKLVDSTHLSGRNITGTSHVTPVIDQLKAMQTYRRFTRMAVIFTPTEVNSLLNVKALREEAERQALTLIEESVPIVGGMPVAAELPTLIARLVPRDPDYLYMGPDSFIGANAKVFTGKALEVGLPTFCSTEAPLRAGDGLFGLVSRYTSVGQLSAHKAVQILRGVPPGQVPVETIARFSLMIRMDVARRLSFYPPLSLLDSAELIGS